MVGAGFWSEIQLTAWANVKNAEIVALCDRHPERLEPAAKQFDIVQTFDDLETMLDSAELDFVDICTRPYSHARLIKLATERGLPVLCQKPLCTSMVEARETVEFCRQAGIRLMVNENYRWRAWYRKAREVLDSGALGRPFLAKIHRRDRSTLPEFRSRQTYFVEMDRLVGYEMGVHYLDTLRFLFGEPDTVYARLHHVSPYVAGEDVLMAVLGYIGLSCIINNSWASVCLPGVDTPEGIIRYGAPLFEIDGSEGTLALTVDGSMHLVTDADHQQWRFGLNAQAESAVATQQHFVDCLENGAEFETSGAETLKTMALVYACYLSAEEGRAVSPKELLE